MRVSVFIARNVSTVAIAITLSGPSHADGGMRPRTPNTPQAAAQHTPQIATLAPQSADAVCQGIIENALQKLRGSKLSDLTAVCADDTCAQAESLVQAIHGLNERIAGLPDGDDKQAAVDSLAELEKHKAALVSMLPKLFPGYSGAELQPEQQAAVRTLQAAKRQCEQIVEALNTKVEAMKKGVAAFEQQANINVCKDKIARLSAYLESVYGIGAGAQAAANRLAIVNARYGDIYNEDRDYRLSMGGDKGAGWGRAKGISSTSAAFMYSVMNPSHPRSGRIFSDAEENDGPIDWHRHRHTCDISWWLKMQCQTKGCPPDATCVGNSYCLVRGIASAAAKMCGYDPSPYGNKRFHIEYSCGGGSPVTTKLPGETTEIHLICAPPPETDPIVERSYFSSGPCPITFPEPASAPASDTPAPAPQPKPEPAAAEPEAN